MSLKLLKAFLCLRFTFDRIEWNCRHFYCIKHKSSYQDMIDLYLGYIGVYFLLLNVFSFKMPCYNLLAFFATTHALLHLACSPKIINILLVSKHTCWNNSNEKAYFNWSCLILHDTISWGFWKCVCLPKWLLKKKDSMHWTCFPLFLVPTGTLHLLLLSVLSWESFDLVGRLQAFVLNIVTTHFQSLFF